MKQLQQKDIKHIRETLAKKNDNKCLITGLDIHNGDAALDHAHENSKCDLSETVEGQIRGAIHRFANSLEGQFRGKFNRSGLAKDITFEDFLYGLYVYLIEAREPFLHPTHIPKPKKLMKSSYNSLKKEITLFNAELKRPIKIPEYPRSKRCTKKLQELFQKFGIQPRFYK